MDGFVLGKTEKIIEQKRKPAFLKFQAMVKYCTKRH